MGQMPSRLGYQPTMGTELSGLEERIANTATGAITSIQAVYVPADDFTDPAAVHTFSHLSASIVLSRDRASEGLFPAIDALQSSSKMATPGIAGERHYNLAQEIRLLPLDEQWQKDLAQIHWPTKNPPELFGRNEATLRAFIREFLFISLFKACAESLASENASRLAAMQRAEKNIDSLLKSLNRTFHRLRQSSIDEELFDVIAGFNALSQKRATS